MIKLPHSLYYLKLFLMISCISILLVSCRFSEIIFYEHEPSQNFNQTFEFNNPEILDFKKNDVVFSVSVKTTNNRNKYIIWLGLWTKKEGRSVKINKATLQGNSWREEANIKLDISLNKRFDNDDLLRGLISKRYFEHESILHGETQIFNITSDIIHEISKDKKNITLKVFFEIDGKSESITYKLKRRSEKYNIYPT